MKNPISISYFSLILIAILTLDYCKKGDIKSAQHNHKELQKTSAAENHLFTIKETGKAILDIKSYFGSIIIYNRSAGTSLSNEHSSYKIMDSYGKSYDFISSTTFKERTITGLFGLAKVFKNNIQIYEEKYDTSDNFHVCGTLDSYIPPIGGSPKTSAIGATKFYWNNGSIITVNFFRNTGSAHIQERIQHYAQVWQRCANIKFKFVPSTQNAEIRIDIGSDNQSYVTGLGTQLITEHHNTDQNSFNMHYGWFTNYTSNNEFCKTVLHEFGHVLGLEHEHRSPNSKINQSAYFSYLKQTQGWDLSKARRQAAFFTAEDQTTNGHRYSKYDPLSIMHYSVPASCTTDGIAVGGNSRLSVADIAFIEAVYPFPVNPIDPTKPIVGTTLYTIRNSLGVPQIDIIRNINNQIFILNRQPGVNLNSKNQTYLILTRTLNGNWHHIAYTFSSGTALNAYTPTGITTSSPILIERKDPGQSLGVLLFKEK